MSPKYVQPEVSLTGSPFWGRMLLDSKERSRKGHQAAGSRQRIRSWEWEVTQRMRDRTRGCHKRDRIWEGMKWKGPC